MTTVLIEFLLGLYFLGVAITKPLYTPWTIDRWKLGLAVVLIVLALLQGARII